MSGLDLGQLVQASTALLGVLGLVLVGAWALRLMRRDGGAQAGSGLRIADSLLLDPRHRLVRVIDGDRAYLLVLGPTGTSRIASRSVPVPAEEVTP